MPASDGSVASLTDFAVDSGLTLTGVGGPEAGGGGGSARRPPGGGKDNDEGSADGTLLAKSILSKSKESEGPPLTTKAVKDLQRAEREKIYTRSLVRIR